MQHEYPTPDGMNAFVWHCARSILKYRAEAAEKKRSYKTRLMYDKLAAGREQLLIDRANKLMDA